ncbi:hypothetical protein HDA32_000439 [Spinactinospora alkalitolerans]|uniref:Uncharacterized protein n=1 Tax=Spinactinospora alkalitolerans TaxID=687207 RepID=A0A852TMY3_9ACTN|nr:hypothetical protein [Spinactinospora alkalitolerans]NYE45319.1 hypothetical protein [Spinactinospora alkalitolerans]
MTAVRVGDADRTREPRRRHRALQLDALRPDAAVSALPGSPPSPAELGDRWIPR